VVWHGAHINGARVSRTHTHAHTRWQHHTTGAAPRVLKRTLQTALVWTLYEELVPRLSALYHVALAQQAAEQEAQQGAESQQQPSKQRRR
jgi:hypothetical protein